MSEIPNDLFYSKTHEWARLEEDNIYSVGITDHAQSQLGDLVFVDLPETSLNVHAGDEVVVVESVKTAADVYSPLTGVIVEVNDVLRNDPERINKNPYGDGWLYRVKISDQSEIEHLLNAESYQDEISEN